MRPLGLSLLLASLALLCSCAEQASELPSVTPKLVALSDANPYQNGWRDAGFRLDPADKIAVIGRDGWPGVTSMERIGNDLFFATNPYGDSSLYAGASWYRYVPGTNRYEWLPFPDQGALEGWVLLDSISYLLSSKGRLFRYAHGQNRWDTLALPYDPKDFLNPNCSMEHLHADTLSFTVFYDTVRHYGKSGRYTDTGIYSDTGKLTKIFLLNVKTGEKGEVVSKDSAVRGWDFSSWIDGMYVGTTMDGDIRHWSPIDSLWHALPASYSGYPRGQVIEYRGALYSPQWSSVLRSRAGGAWEEIAIPGRFPSGSKTLNWGDIGQLQAIGDTLYALGSSVRIFDPATNIFKEVAGEFTSGDLPPKSAYCKGNRGCFNMGFGWNLAKFGDTIYFGTSQGLWKISLSKAVVCDPMAYGNNSDICGIVALQEQCIWDYEYCCKYQHVDSLGVCKEYVCPAARAASGILNPLQSR